MLSRTDPNEETAVGNIIGLGHQLLRLITGFLAVNPEKQKKYLKIEGTLGSKTSESLHKAK